jgi:kinesin family protein C2/C3
MIDSAMDGNQVCLMVHGHTGSGKSYTIEGTEEQPGIILRAAWKPTKQILKTKKY